ncbi:MAG: type II and III secretion system protein family protein [Alphaproteobacteria bacterium]|nr:type II and III secretion system protein family protein [Alphaproteobacteria bacterium]
MKSALVSLLLLFVVIIAPAIAGAEEEPLILSVDRSENIKLQEPADTVFIASPDIADVQVVAPNVITIYGRKQGETTVTASKKDGTILLKRKIVVDQDLGKLQNVLGSMPKIKALPVPGGIVLNGEAASSREAADAQRIAKRFLGNDKEEVINHLRLKNDEQIQLRVRVAEVSKNISKTFGINWDAISLAGGITLGLKSGASFLSDTILRNSNVSNAADRYSRSNVNNGVYAGYNGNGYSINGLIDALAQDGLVTLLAEPNLTAKSGETATFLAGGEFPVPVPQQNGAITIEFKPYGVSLAFTPTVLGKDRISIQVRPEVSELTTSGSISLNNIAIPALLTRRAETTVELGSGQSFAIGGLIRSYQNNDVSKYPFLGDIPVLGALFTSTRFRNSETELVIIVTPYLVKPSSEQLAAPTDGYAPANDVDRILLGKVHSNSVPNEPRNMGEILQGPVGYSAE